MVIIDNGAGAKDQLLWGIKTVVAKTGLSRASIYRYIKRERFPPRRRVGPNRVAWVPAEVIAWIEARAKLGPGRATAKNRPGTRPRNPPPSAHLKSENACEDPLAADDAQPAANRTPWSTSCSPTGTGSST
ncbi:MAG: helix-turn-helix transcriptional regulator [Hyphomicrobiaceae bacterium]